MHISADNRLSGTATAPAPLADAAQARDTAGRFHWFVWYAAIALLNLLALCGGVGLSSWQSSQLRAALQDHRRYTVVIGEIANVRQMAARVDAPPNDIFLTHDVARETQRLQSAVASFLKSFTELRLAIAGLNADSRAAFERHLPAIEENAATMSREARLVFSLDHSGDAAAATEHMALVDRAYADLLARLWSMGREITALQGTLLATQELQQADVHLYKTLLTVIVAIVTMLGLIHGGRLYRVMTEKSAALARARDEAERAARVKARFLANMSHEIRTPMNGVMGMLDALDATSLRPEQQQILHTARTSAELLLAIIDDVLDFSKIEAGLLLIEKIPFNTRDAVRRAAQLHEARAREKGLTIVCRVDESLPTALVGDPTRLTQVLSNFLSNAIKFSRSGAGTIDVQVKIKTLTSDAACVHFSVKDRGIGIPQEKQGKLFTAFTQADDSTSRRFGGTGLGLAICKQIVELLDPDSGEIGVISAAGEGAEFYFTTTMQRTSESAIVPVQHTPSAAKTNRARFGGMRVLVAEDDAINRQVALLMLRRFGIEPTMAVDGEEALQRAKQSKFDLIFMDCHMPERDGCEATHAIRAHEQATSASRTPIVALTASVLAADKSKCIDAGMDDFLAKPLRESGLDAALARWARVTTDSSVSSDGAAEHNSRPETEASFIDRQRIAEMRNMAGENFSTLVEQFNENARRSRAMMAERCAANDATELRNVAHRLKGGSSGLGLSRIATICGRLEDFAAGGDTGQAQSLLQELDVALEEIREYFAEDLREAGTQKGSYRTALRSTGAA